jgi:hypothetical protein
VRSAPTPFGPDGGRDGPGPFACIPEPFGRLRAGSATGPPAGQRHSIDGGFAGGEEVRLGGKGVGGTEFIGERVAAFLLGFVHTLSEAANGSPKAVVACR